MKPDFRKYHERKLHELKSEDDHQRALISWANEPETLAKYPMLKWLFSVPNGGARSLKTASLMKQTGVKRGVPDLMLLYPINRYHGLIIEMKFGKNKLSVEQSEFIRDHLTLGYRCVVCYSWIDAKKIIEAYLEVGG